jgi:Peptidase family M48
MRTASIAILLLSAALFAGALRAQQPCPAPPALSPAPGTNIFNPQQELDLGDVESEWLEKNYRVIHDDELAARLNLVVNRILAQLPPTPLKFRVILIDTPVVNSFSVGAGRIYVTRKMVAFLRNDDELAGLLGHEMGHILTHQNAIEMTRMFHDLLGVTSVGDRQDIFEKYNRMLDGIARNRSALEKALNREASQEEPHQYEADRVALYAAAAAGYSPQAFVDFFERLAQTHGKTGNLLTDFFGTTSPDQKRLRELHKSLDLLPPACRSVAASAPSADFLAWQAEVIAYSGLGLREQLVGVISKERLEPPLRTDIRNLKFSPDGAYSLAQDDADIFVFANDPFSFLFRIDATEAHAAQFSQDSQNILFFTRGLRVEEWNIADQARTGIHELSLPEGCVESALSHDGKILACINRNFDFSLVDVAAGSTLFAKKNYFEPKMPGVSGDLLRLVLAVLMEAEDGRWIHMGFSPDDHYFVGTGAGLAIAVDVPGKSQIPVRGGLRDMLTADFAFLASDRLIVENRFDPKSSAVVEFPSGKVLERLPVSPRQDMEAPTRGNYVILRPVKDARVGVLDLASQHFVIGSTKSAAIDVYDRDVLSQRVSGEVGLFDLATHQLKGQVELPRSTLGTLLAWAVSPDLRWLAISGTSRAAVWDLSTSQRLYYTRGFRGAYFEGDQFFYADFPKEDPQPRTIARAELSRQDMVPGAPLDDNAVARQYGQFLVVRTPAGKDNSLTRNITLQVEDVRDLHVLWSRTFPKEAPGTATNPPFDSLTFEWPIEDSAAKDEIKSNAALQSRVAALRDRKDAQLLEVLDAATGAVRGQLLIDTGKGSFRVRSAFSAGDWVFVGDNENRTHVYSLSSGEERAILFGSSAKASAAAGILLLENGTGQIDVYDLKTFEKRAHLTFPYHLSAAAFSADGRRLLILSANQVAYVFDTQILAQPQTAVAK